LEASENDTPQVERTRNRTLADWLLASQVTHAAMEATGVYWNPVWHILESVREPVLANSAHVRNVPGRIRISFARQRV